MFRLLWLAGIDLRSCVRILRPRPSRALCLSSPPTSRARTGVVGAVTECTSPPHAARPRRQLGLSPPPFPRLLLPSHGPQRSFALAPTRPCILTTAAAAVERRQHLRQRRLWRHWCSRVTWSRRQSRRRTRRSGPCFVSPPCNPPPVSHTPPLPVGGVGGTRNFGVPPPPPRRRRCRLRRVVQSGG